ncbi:hypothetical protein [Dasania marina]|uniref:hypothetical protein n=1 Tax=Dasania marina TaxID=471499 RepID=UPI0030D9FCE3|tara:strand:+ start:51445 stop:51912 length:468 start_codon:yes stop_codon:yes gene_type:complete
MTSWNYRIIKKTDPLNNEQVYQVHEVYYSNSGTIECWNDNPVEPMGVNTAGLRNDIQAFLSAFRLPAMHEQTVNGRHTLIEEQLPAKRHDNYSDYQQKTERALGYINQILGNNLILKKDPALRLAFEKVELALHDLKNLAAAEQQALISPIKSNG